MIHFFFFSQIRELVADGAEENKELLEVSMHL